MSEKNWMEKEVCDYTSADMVEAIEYELHNIDCSVSNARKLLKELWIRLTEENKK